MQRRGASGAFVRHLGAALATWLLLGGSSASSGRSTASTSEAADPASVTGTLRVLTPSYPSSSTGQVALQTVLDAFHTTYPQVTVEPDITNFGQLNEKISTSLASGRPYDVCITGMGWTPPFASKVCSPTCPRMASPGTRWELKSTRPSFRPARTTAQRTAFR